MNLVNQINTRGILVGAITILLVSISGCAIIPDNWAFTKEIMNTDELSQIKRIALLDVPVPSQIVLGSELSDSATAAFGLVGMFTVEDTEGNKITSGSLLSSTTQEELKNHLEKDGREVVLLEAERKDKSAMLKNYDQFKRVDADAILEVAFTRVGFGERLGFSSGSELGPTLMYKYRLLSTKDRQVLIESNVYYDTFVYESYLSTVGHRIYGPSSHIFEDEEALENNLEEAVRRLKHAIKEATGVIAKYVTNTFEEFFTKVAFTGDFSGTYISSTTGKNPSYFGFRGPTHEITLVQNGDQIEGSYGNGLPGKVWGVVEGNTIKFDWSKSGNTNNGRGKWTFQPGSSEVAGTWYRGQFYGKWNLVKIE